jgi:CHAT domain-containing protein
MRDLWIAKTGPFPNLPRLLLFIAIPVAVSGCTASMSREEAKQVSITIEETAIARPSRRISDILAVLDQKGQFDARSTAQMKAKLSVSPPEGTNDADLARFHRERGFAEWQLGFAKPALDDFRLALTYSQKIDRVDAVLLRRLGIIEKDSGNFQSAVDHLEEALELKADMTTYDQLIDAYIRMGDLETAEAYNRENQELYSRNKWKQIRGGQAAVNRGKLKPGSTRPGGKAGGAKPAGPRPGDAKPATDQMKSMQANLDEVHLNNAMASVLDAKGRYEEAEPYLRKELELHHVQSVVEMIPRYAIINRLRLSLNLSRQQRFIDAEIEARQALKEALGHGGVESDLTVKAVERLAGVMLGQRRLNDAEQLARAAIRILENSGFPSDSGLMCSSRAFLGDVLCLQEDFPEAMKQYDLAREGMKENAYLYEKSFTRKRNLMLTLLRSGRLDEAMTIISRVYEWNRKNYGEKHMETVLTLGLRAMAHTMAGNHRQAFEDFSSALPGLTGRSGGRDVVPNKLTRTILIAYIDFLGRIYGTPMEQELRVHAADESFRIVSFLGGRSVQTALGESSARAAAAYDSELADLVRKEQDLNKQIAGLQETLSDAMMALPDQQDPRALNALKAEIDSLIKARGIALEAINDRFPKYANFTNPEPVAAAKVREILHPKEAFISIYSANDKIYVWAVPQRGETRFSVVPMGRRTLTETVMNLRKALDPNPSTLGDIPAFDLVSAYNLYYRILKPVEPAWRDAEDLLVAVSGPLGQLPLSLLPTEPVQLAGEKGELFADYRDVPWLIRRVSVTMLPSINALLTLRSLPEGDPKRKSFAGFGDPIFNPQQLAMGEDTPSNTPAPKAKETTPGNIQLASRGIRVQVRGVRITEKGNLDSGNIVSAQLNKLDRLPDTAEEIRSIAGVLNAPPGSSIFLGKDFSKQRLTMMNLADRRVLAFATHALVPGDLDGLDQPALALSSPAVTGEKGDGILKVDEILKLKLNADWVVLSACNTGASGGQGADAVSGLGRAFFYAGTRALLVTMWSVETTSAKKLVTGIFQAQEENKALSRAQALRKSMLNLIDREFLKDPATGKIVASYAHPLFWAPFIVVGDPGKGL